MATLNKALNPGSSSKKESKGMSRRTKGLIAAIGIYAGITTAGCLIILASNSFPQSEIGNPQVKNKEIGDQASDISSRGTSENTKQAIFDPAESISKHVHYYPDSSKPWLNSQEYKKVMGDLARVQYKMLKDRSAATNYPTTVIGNGSFSQPECTLSGPTLGVYNGHCNTIQVNFAGGGMAYERPIEVSTTLAHEYAHHLVNVTIGANSISGLENELIADCFAGLMHGYWNNHGKLSKEEFRAAGIMMIQVSKQAESLTDEHGDPGQRQGAFIAGALRANGKITKPYRNFCTGLDRIIDFSKGLP